jgi:hypothetical protein
MHNGFGSHAAGGVLGGAMGTLVMRQGLRQVARRLPERLMPTPIRRDPAELVVDRLETMRRRPLTRKAHDALVGALHYAPGIGYGALFGLATARHKLRSVRGALLAGAALGTVVWAVSYGGVLPATRLTPPVHRQGVRHAGAALLAHVAYGLVSALPILVLDRVIPREPAWKRALRALFR